MYSIELGAHFKALELSFEMIFQRKPSKLIKNTIWPWIFKVIWFQNSDKLYAIGQYLLNIHCKFGDGAVNMLRATKCLLVYGANVHIVEFGSLHNVSHLL
jgi:hypothetical protein